MGIKIYSFFHNYLEIICIDSTCQESSFLFLYYRGAYTKTTIGKTNKIPKRYLYLATYLELIVHSAAQYSKFLYLVCILYLIVVQIIS